MVVARPRSVQRPCSTICGNLFLSCLDQRLRIARTGTNAWPCWTNDYAPTHNDNTRVRMLSVQWAVTSELADSEDKSTGLPSLLYRITGRGEPDSTPVN